MSGNSSRIQHSYSCVCQGCSSERQIEVQHEQQIQQWREQQWAAGNPNITNSSTPWDGASK